MHNSSMFNIHLAKVYGFCRGVQAVSQLADELVDGEQSPVYSIGKLVHNDQVVKYYDERGLKVVTSPAGNAPGIALIRAHGITSEKRKEFEDAGFTLIDGTCRIVLTNHAKCEKSSRPVLFFGIKGHAETLSTVDRLKVDYLIIENEEDLDAVDPSRKWNVVIQTTFSSLKAERFKAVLASRGIDFRCLNAICSASSRRREALLLLCGCCDTVLVVGDRQSANTMELYRIACQQDVRAYFVSCVQDITDEMLQCRDLGITAGASVSPRQVRDFLAFLKQRGGTVVQS